jgi:hypothetical protein
MLVFDVENSNDVIRKRKKVLIHRKSIQNILENIAGMSDIAITKLVLGNI